MLAFRCLFILAVAAATMTTTTIIASPPAFGESSIPIAYIDPLSGPGATAGIQFGKHLTYYAERINESGGIVGQNVNFVSMDSKQSPQEALVLLQQAIDHGVHYVVTGASSAVSAALSEAIDKNNRRNPANSVVLFNFAAAPDLTNEKCSFWQFRLDADGVMKAKALAIAIAKRPEIKRVYLINPDYSLGRSVSEAARRELGSRRPDITIVGDEFLPLLKVLDFAPYVEKVRSSGAEAILTADFSTDLVLLAQSVRDAGLKTDLYTLYGGTQGTVSAIGSAGVDHLRSVSEWHKNVAPDLDPDAIGFEKRFTAKNDEYTFSVTRHLFEFLKAGMERSESVDPRKVATAISGLKLSTPEGELELRDDNHQLLIPQLVSVLSDKVKFDVEKTGFGFRTEVTVGADELRLPTTCSMKRP
jgi:branched-chain amino acid transport system substrate-binding protein